MRNRLSLHELLCNILGSRNVYFQPNSNVLMQYPAIRYRRSDISNEHANNDVYLSRNQYEIIVIYTDPDSDLPDKVNQIPSARAIRSYVEDGLYHWIFTIYY